MRKSWPLVENMLVSLAANKDIDFDEFRDEDVAQTAYEILISEQGAGILNRLYTNMYAPDDSACFTRTVCEEAAKALLEE